MAKARRQKKPKIIVLYNENPDWPQVDKDWSTEMLATMTAGLSEQGYSFEPLKFFDNLDALDRFDRREWLVWNWGEEWAGQSWSEARVADEVERRGFVFTGASGDTFRQVQNRMQVKKRLRAARLPTLPARVMANPARAGEWKNYPAIVKGLNQHSSYGLGREAVVANAKELARRIRYLRDELGDKALVEPFLDTREFHVAVWGNAQPEALPPVEFDYSIFPDPRDRIYTYEWKFDRTSRGFNGIRNPCPAPAGNPALQARLEAVAVAAYRLMGLRDYGRIDLRMLGDEPQILDVNANPDLDLTSVLPISACKLGLTFGQLIDRILGFASERMALAARRPEPAAPAAKRRRAPAKATS